MCRYKLTNYLNGGARAGIAALAFGTAGQVFAQDAIFDISNRPTLNFYGSAGLIDMPTAEPLPDGQFAVSISSFGGNNRTNLTFQATPRLSASFRYVGIKNWNSDGFATYRDRSFDVRYLLKKEDRIWPALTVGLQDFAGTGIYAGEYIVATKNFSGDRVPGHIKVSAGLGWGRLGSAGSIGSPFGGNRPAYVPGSTGGTLSVDQWFRGEMAPFAGLEWQVNDKLGLKAEYSSDAYIAETVGNTIFTRKSRFNFGAEYQATERLRLGAYYLYGSEFGFNAQFQLHPSRPASPMFLKPTAPVKQRPSRAKSPEKWGTEWSAKASTMGILAEKLKPLLKSQGLTLVSLKVSANSAELRFRNRTYHATSVAVGRAARALSWVMPASVETFRIVPVEENLAQSAVVIRRSSLERYEFAADGANKLRKNSSIEEAQPRLVDAFHNQELYPDFSWSVGPYASFSYFDPDEPIRMDAGVKLDLQYRPAPGWKVAGSLTHRLAGNVASSNRLSNSVLPHVRTDSVLYSRGSDTKINTLYVSKQWKPSEDVYARLTAGYLERMYGGVSAEVLWKPVASRLALGVEANYAQKRDFDGHFGFQDYGVATGHASAYYEFGEGYLGQVDVGRYLAGDYGATMSLSREFANGWKVGGFFTLTNVSSEDFGEGSFDKGITLTIPASWFLGNAGRQSYETTIRPIQRDGGARLKVPGRLYEQVRGGHRNALDTQWPGVYQ